MATSPSFKSIAYPYGVVLGVFSILNLVLLYVFNVQQGNWIMGLVNFVITFAIFAMAIKTYKQNNQGLLSIREALKMGLAVAVIGGLIAGVYAFIHYSYISPEFIEMIREEAFLQISEQTLQEEQREQAVQITNITTSPLFFATITLVSSLFFGFLISLITGAIMKSTRAY